MRFRRQKGLCRIPSEGRVLSLRASKSCRNQLKCLTSLDHRIHELVDVYQNLVHVGVYQNHVGVTSITVSHLLLTNQIAVFVTTMI